MTADAPEGVKRPTKAVAKTALSMLKSQRDRCRTIAEKHTAAADSDGGRHKEFWLKSAGRNARDTDRLTEFMDWMTQEFHL